MSIPIQVFDRVRQTPVDKHEFSSNSIKVGRQPTCDLVLTSPDVSRVHALIRRHDDRFLLEVVGRNGTLVDGDLVPQHATVHVVPQQCIQIAGYELYLDLPAVATRAVAAADALAGLQLSLHRELLAHLDNLKDSPPESANDEAAVRIRSVLSDLVQRHVTAMDAASVSRDALEYGVEDSLLRECVQRVFEIRDEREDAARMRGFVASLDRQVAVLIDVLLERMGVRPGSDMTLRQSLVRIQEQFGAAYREVGPVLTDELRLIVIHRFLLCEVLNLVFGLGPLQDLLVLPSITEIMVVQKDLIYVERDGRLEQIHRSFVTDEILVAIINRICDPLNRSISVSSPMVDARLPDGHRVNAVIPPLAIKGPCLTIRKFVPSLNIARLMELGAFTPPVSRFLEACVKARKNVVVAGGTGSGKTTLLNALSGFVSEDERIVTIEDSAELDLEQQHVVTLETRPPNVEGKGAYTIRDLLRNALRMRPDRIIIGECRGGEALDMLQAMNTGHEGSMTTLHANSTKDALMRMETMVLEAVDLPVRAIREQINTAVDLIVYQARLGEGGSGRRAVTAIAELVGIDPDTGEMLVADIFEMRGDRLEFSGYLPTFVRQLISRGDLDPAVFFHHDRRAAS